MSKKFDKNTERVDPELNPPSINSNNQKEHSEIEITPPIIKTLKKENEKVHDPIKSNNLKSVGRENDKTIELERKNIKLFHNLFFATTLVSYLLNSGFYNRRYELISDVVSMSGGLLGGLRYLIADLIIYPYLSVLLIILFISILLLTFNKILKIGPKNFYSNWSKTLKIIILASYVLFWIFFIVIDLFEYGIR